MATNQLPKFMTPEIIIAEQKNEIATLRAEAKTKQEWILALAVTLAFFMTLAFISAFTAAELQDKLKGDEAALVILKK